MKKISLFIILFFISVKATSLDTVSIQLKWLHGMQFIGLYAAIEKGYYQEEGLSVILKEWGLGKNYIQAVTDGDAQYGISDAGLLVSKLQGKPVVLLSQIYQHSPYILLTRRNSGIISPYELSGKTIALDIDNTSEAPITAMLTSVLGGMDRVRIIRNNPELKVQQLVSGEADAIVAYLNNEPLIFKDHGIPVTVINPQNYGIDFYGDNLFTTIDEIKKHPDRVMKVISATLRGWDYALNNPDEMIELGQKKFKISRKAAAYQLQIIRNMIQKDIVPLGSILKERYDLVSSIYYSCGLIRSQQIPKDFFWNSDNRLTPSEKKWLNAHSPIQFGIDSAWVPMIVRDTLGNWNGIEVEILNLLNEKLGTDFTLLPGNWGEHLTAVKEKRLAGIALSAPMKERKNFLNFTLPYSKAQKYIVVRADDKRPLNTLKDLKGYKVAIGKGWTYEEAMLRNADTAIQIVQVKPSQRFELLLSGEVDAIVVNPTFFYLLNAGENMFVNIALTPKEGQFPINYSIRKDWDTLVTIMNKGITLISQDEIFAINQRWGFNKSINGTKVSQSESFISTLTNEERTWFLEHPDIRIGFDPVWPPLEYLAQNGTIQGESIDIIREIETLLARNFIKIGDQPWDTLISQVKKNDLDAFACISPTDKRGEYLTFTKPYLTLNIVLFTRDNITYIHSMKELKGRKIGIISGYAIEEWMQRDFPSLTYVKVSDTRSGMKALSRGDIDVFIENIMSGSYVLGELGYTNIKVSGETPWKNDLCIGIRKDWPLLRDILQKAIDAIPESSKNEIHRKWQNIEFVTRINTRTIMQIVIPLIIILIISLIWNRKLKKEANQRKKAEQHAIDANKAKSAFLANMSHEIRTPLNAIIGFTHIATNVEKNAIILDYLQSIQTSSISLLSLINDILDISKVESGRVELQESPIHIIPFLHEIELLFTQQATNKGIALQLIVDSDFLHPLMIDETRVRQVLINLVNNAIKFTSNGFVELRTRHSEDSNGHCTIIFEVQDSGKGIPADQLDTIFDVFTQVKGQSLTEYGGTGLGLSISRKLINLMGGTITVSSELGKGSLFTVSIPNVQIVTNPIPKKGTDSLNIDTISFYPATLLVADDVEINRRIIKGFIQNQPITILEASNGKEAFEIIQKQRPSVILLDLKMPIMSGHDVLQKLLEDPQLKNIPVIIITASILNEEEKTIKPLVADFLRKPFLPNALIRALMKVLPYDRVDSKTPAGPEKLSNDLPAISLALCQYLKNHNETIKRLIRTVSFEDIEIFLKQVLEIAKNENDTKIVSWGDELQKALDQFDVEKITSLLTIMENSKNCQD